MLLFSFKRKSNSLSTNNDIGIQCQNHRVYPKSKPFSLNFLDITKLIMNNIAVCLVSCRWQRCPYTVETGFSKWATRAQAEALVPSTMWYTVFQNFICAKIHTESRWIFCHTPHPQNSMQAVCLRASDFVHLMGGGIPVFLD